METFFFLIFFFPFFPAANFGSKDSLPKTDDYLRRREDVEGGGLK